ncbi:helix-turn-helix domain-containing protein [Paenibacillus hamazuiensis]|uniref:helix-turn-helix domain-containing protein n=1 Tax=Paenibacillus hamazuiensis TaxID=2936508 RepID=UPI00200F22B1|nr:helix-turn-helix domain-containing protein [Paenibacillus hamazuiensis]
MNITLENQFQLVICLGDAAAAFTEYELDYVYLLCSDLCHQELNKSRDMELEKMIEGIRMLTSTLDLNELLQTIIRSAITVISAGDAGIFRLFDRQSSLLVPLALIGFDDSFARYKTKKGEAISGKVFADGIPRIYQSKQEMLRDYTNISEENIDYVKNEKKANALMSVPVSLGETRIGTLTILQFSKKRNFTNRDLQLLQGFASQVAIAIHNAKLYEETSLRLKQVTELSTKLEENNRLLQKRIHVHDTLTQLSLKNKGIKNLVNEINRILGMPVSYVDCLDNEIYTGPQSKNKISFAAISEMFENRQKAPMSVSWFNQDYFVYPITIGTVLLGCIIVTASHPLTPMDTITVEQSGSVLTLEIIKKFSITELYYKKTKEYFQQILDMQDREQIISKGRQFHFTFYSYTFVVLCEIPGLFEPYEVEAKIQRLIAKFDKELANISKLVFGDHNKVTLLISVNDIAEIEKAIHQMKAVIKEWESGDNHLLRGGIGTAYKEPEDIIKSNSEANKTVAFATNRNKFGLMRYEEISLNRFFLNQPIQEIEKYIEEILAPLRSDKIQNKDLEKTLMVYISSNKSAVESAKKLHIHINSLYQRLKKIEELLNLRFDDPEDMLKIQLACHLKNTFI